VRPGWRADERAADGARAIPGPEQPEDTTGAAPPSPAAAGGAWGAVVYVVGRISAQ